MNPSPSKCALSQIFPTYPMLSSLPPLTFFSVSQPLFVNKWYLPVYDLYLGKTLDHFQLLHHPQFNKDWCQSYSNEFSCLCQGVGEKPNSLAQHVEGTNTFHAIRYRYVPADRRKEVTYTKVVCKLKNQQGGQKPHVNHR